jgi:hypothetical protein
MKTLVKKLVPIVVVCLGTALLFTLTDPDSVLAATEATQDYSLGPALRKLQKPARLAAGFFAAWGFLIIAKGDSGKGLRRIYLAFGGYAGIMGLEWIFNFIDSFFGW